MMWSRGRWWGGAVAAMMLAATAGAWADTEATQAVKEIVQKIRQEQKIGDNDPIPCMKLSNQQLENLGMAVSEMVWPKSDQRDFMWRVLGGKNSDQVKIMQRMMALHYLGCGAWGMGGCGMHGGKGAKQSGWGMHGDRDDREGMGYGMMGYGMGPGMLGGRGQGGYGYQGSAMEQLKMRYANGEITEEQYQKMKKVLEEGK